MSKPMKYDFEGWATVYNVRCADGRTIRPGAFKDCDGAEVPIVWGHNHTSPEYVLGHGILEDRKEGMWFYGSLNDSPLAQKSKELLKHRDITCMSICANRLVQDEGMNVEHGIVREVSLVLAGANPHAKIDFGLAHDALIDDDDVAAVICHNIENLELFHEDASEENQNDPQNEADKKPENNSDKENEEMENQNQQNQEELEHAGEDMTVEEYLNSLDEEDRDIVMAIIGQVIEQTKADMKQSDDENENNTEEGTEMKHNAFDNNKNDQLKHGATEEDEILTHAEELQIFDEAIHSGSGSLREATLKHGVELHDSDFELNHSITNIGYLYPDAKSVTPEPIIISREMAWVSAVMNGVRHTPFTNVKSLFANITADEARAKGYATKGTQKIEEVIAMLKRVTTPATIYKLQKIDRDDVLDITEYSTVAFMKKEMQVMAREEGARAILIGDGRSAIAQDKIKEDCIRPIWKDDELFVIRKDVEWDAGDTDTKKLKKIIRAAVKARKDYKGSGNPVLFTTEDILTDLLLLEDANGRAIYETQDKLARALRVSAIYTVPVMENQSRVGTGDDTGYTFDLLGIIVNLADYNIGTNKGGELTMFDDFDLNFNKYEYLLETRFSGALVTPYSAIILENKHETVNA